MIKRKWTKDIAGNKFERKDEADADKEPKHFNIQESGPGGLVSQTYLVPDTSGVFE